ncbi:MAG TPA: histidine phosphatase family protein [Candidatus Angelobacter sp.]|nr:histidine phosphatase family protein [Candidatus Angelobacter sp.]
MKSRTRPPDAYMPLNGLAGRSVSVRNGDHSTPMSKRCRTLFLVRHGQYSSEGLTRVGKMQASHTARRIRHVPATSIHCSTMKRAVQTAQIIAREHRGLPLRRASLLRECVPGLPPALRKGSTVSVETMTRGKDQADRAYRRYFKCSVGRDACDVLVCHGNLIRYLVCRALALGTYAWCSLGSAHCGITEIRIMANGELVLVSYNDTGHLPEKLRAT